MILQAKDAKRIAENFNKGLDADGNPSPETLSCVENIMASVKVASAKGHFSISVERNSVKNEAIKNILESYGYKISVDTTNEIPGYIISW